MRLPRTTGALSGALIVVLGLWAALIPFVGPYFHYAIGVDHAWHWGMKRLWFDVLPGAVAIVGGLMLIRSDRRASGGLGGWLAVAAGAWLIVGPSLSLLWQHAPGAIGTPHGGTHRQALELIGFYYAVGALIVGLAAFATGRFVSRPRIVEEPAAVAAAGAAESSGRRRPLLGRRGARPARRERAAAE